MSIPVKQILSLKTQDKYIIKSIFLQKKKPKRVIFLLIFKYKQLIKRPLSRYSYK